MESLEEIFFNSEAINDSLAHLYAGNRAKWNPSTVDQLNLSFADFARNFDTFAPAILDEVRRGTYQFSPARPTSIFADKPRIIYRLCWSDHFLLLHLARSIEKVTAKHLPDCLFSYRKGRSAHQALRRLSKFLSNNTGPFFVARRDIKSFGETMDHQCLMDDFVHYTNPSRKLCKLFRNICRFPLNAEDAGAQCIRQGLPTGHYVQLVFENLYLLEIDRVLSNVPDSLYLRFGDDILFVTTDQKRFIESTKRLDAYVASRRVVYNSKKSSNLILAKPHALADLAGRLEFLPVSIFSYLGMRIDWLGRISLTKAKQKRQLGLIKSRLRRVNQLAPKGLTPESRINLLIQTACELLAAGRRIESGLARDYLLSLHDGRQVAEFDRWLALTVLKLGLGKGHKKGLLGRFPISELRRRGLPSCLSLWGRHAQS